MSIISVQFIAPFHSAFSGKKTKHTDSEVTKTHVSNRHYRVNLVTAGTAKLLFKPSVWKGQPIRIRQL